MQSANQDYEQLLGLTKPWMVSDRDLDIEAKRLVIKVTAEKGEKLPCPRCGTPCSQADHREERSWRHLDTMQFTTVITCRVPRIRCVKHGVLSADVPWAGSYSRFTELFETFSIDVLQASKSITSARLLLRLSWDQIHEIQKRAVQRGMARRRGEQIRHIGIDEKSFLRGHSYASLMTDIDQGRVLEVMRNRDEQTAKELLDTLTDHQKATVEAIAMDMWPAFMNAARIIIPKADIVHDKFHISGYLGKAVDTVRRKENSQFIKAGDDTLKGSKYLWLTNPANWSDKHKSSFRCMAIDELKVGRAWSIKEAFRHFWTYAYKGAAISFFKRWYFWATHSKLKPIIETARTLKRHLSGILAYLKHHITNAATEGLNSKIQSIKANSRGFRNFEHYRIAILFHCGKLSMYP